MSALQKLKRAVAPAAILASFVLTAALPGNAEARSYEKRECVRVGANLGQVAGAYAASGKNEARALAAALGQLMGQVAGNKICDEPEPEPVSQRTRDSQRNYR